MMPRVSFFSYVDTLHGAELRVKLGQTAGISAVLIRILTFNVRLIVFLNLGFLHTIILIVVKVE